MIDLAQMKARVLSNPDALAEYESQAPEYQLVHELLAARTRSGLSQAEMARRMHTSQSAIARLESGKALPSLRTLNSYAKAMGYKAIIKLEAIETE